MAPGLAGGARFGVRQLAAALAGPACRPHTGVGWLMAASKLTEEKRQLAAALQSCTPDGRLCSPSGFVLTAWPFMVAYLCDGQGAKSPAVAVGRNSKRIRPRADGRGREQKDCFYTNEATNLLKTKEEH